MRTLILIVLIALLTPHARGQQYLDSFSYLGSHNSYERGLHPAAPPFSLPYDGVRTQIDTQIGLIGVYMLEFDLCYTSDNRLIVKHSCSFPLFEEFNAYELRNELFNEPSVFERVTWIYLDIKNDSCCNNWPTSFHEREEIVWNWFTGNRTLTGPDGVTLIADMVYTVNDWKNPALQAANYGLGAEQWPTMAQLVEQKKHFIISWNRNWDTFPEQQIFLDYRINPDNVLESIPISSGIVNYSDEDLVPVGVNALVGDRAVLAAFPTVYWDDINSDGWNRALSVGTNYIRTNNLIAPWTRSGPVHHPFPTYVNPSVTTFRFGTRLAPFSTLSDAINRIEQTVPRAEYVTPVKLRTGTYTLGQNAVIDTPVRLEADGGAVILTD